MGKNLTADLRRKVAQKIKDVGLVPSHFLVYRARAEECHKFLDGIEGGVAISVAAARLRAAVIKRQSGADAGGVPADAGVEGQPGAGGSLDAIIAGIAAKAAQATLDAHKDRLLDEARVREIATEAATEAVRGIAPVRVQLLDTGEVREVGRQHRMFPELLRWISIGRPILLHGLAGSGKTTAARKAAEALGMQPVVLHLGPQTTQSSIFGYFDAQGRYVDTPFVRAYQQTGEFERGAMIVLDELDRCNPRVAVTLNGSIENGHMTLPCGEIKRGDRVVIVACTNTVMSGADREYVSAQQQDAAFRDRFVFLSWDYDEEFEMELALAENPDAREWVAKVQSYRRGARKIGARIVISPRASIVGARALAAGISEKDVEAAVIWKGIPEETAKKIRAAAGKEA